MLSSGLHRGRSADSVWLDGQWDEGFDVGRRPALYDGGLGSAGIKPADRHHSFYMFEGSQYR